MAVRIPISADASSVKRELDGVQAAADSARDAAKAFSEINFAHPELVTVAADLERVRDNFERLMKVGRGETAAAMRKVYDGSGGNLFGTGGIMDRLQGSYTDPAHGQRVVNQAQAFLLQGTSAAAAASQVPSAPAPAPAPVQPPPAPPPPPPPPPAQRQRTPQSGDDEGSNGRSIGELMGAVAGPIKTLLAYAGLQGLGSMVGHSLQLGQQESIGNDTLYRSMNGSSRSFDELEASVRRAADGLGVTYQESQRLAGAMVKLGGTMTPDMLMHNLRTSTEFARAYGMDPGDVAQTFTRMSMLDDRGNGATSGGDRPEQFTRQAEMIAEAVQAGSMGGRTEEVMHALLNWTEKQSRMTVSPLGADQGFSALYSSLNATGMAGLRGSAGEALIGQVDSSIRRGGAGGQASEYLTYKTFRNAGITNPYEVEYDLSQGMFNPIGKNGESTYDLMQKELENQYGHRTGKDGKPNYRLMMAMSRQYGITMSQADGLAMAPAVDVHAGEKEIARLGVDTSHFSVSAYPDAFRIATESPDKLADEAKKMQNGRLNGRMSTEEAQSLEGLSGDALKKRLIEMTGKYGMEETDGSATREASAHLTNAMTGLGAKMEKLITPLTDVIAKVGDALDMLLAIGGKSFGGSGGPELALPPESGVTNASYSRLAPGSGGLGKGGPMSSAGWASVPISVQNAIHAASANRGVPEALLASLMQGESGFDAKQVTKGGGGWGAIGLGQIRRSSGTKLTPEQLLDPNMNADETARLLVDLYKQYGNWDMALRAYRAGGDPAAQQKYGAAGYAAKVLRNSNNFNGPIPGASGGTGHTVTVRPEPLVVVHQTESGRVIKREHVPMVHVGPPQPWGTPDMASA